MNKNLENVIKNLLPQLEKADEIVISHQITEKNLEKIYKNFHIKNPKVTYLQMIEKWLSKNRNNALKYAKSDICVICDDDVNFCKNFEKTIKNTYKNHENTDVITFDIITPNGKKLYFHKTGKHTIFSALKIYSQGITFRRKKIMENQIFFDENFWLWSQNPSGEENIFLWECYKKWLKCFHSAENLKIHPEISSGILYTNPEKDIISKVRVFEKILGKTGWLLSVFYLAIFHYKFYKNKISIFKFIKIGLKWLKKEG